jgi:hypothetical protein
MAGHFWEAAVTACAYVEHLQHHYEFDSVTNDGGRRHLSLRPVMSAEIA